MLFREQVYPRYFITMQGYYAAVRYSMRERWFSPSQKNKKEYSVEFSQKLGGVQALTTTQSSSPTVRKRCGWLLSKA